MTSPKTNRSNKPKTDTKVGCHTEAERLSEAHTHQRPMLRVSHNVPKMGRADGARDRCHTIRNRQRNTADPTTDSASVRAERPFFSSRRKQPTSHGSSADTVKLAMIIAHAALEKKASNVDIIDLAGKVDYADYLVFMSGSSERHVNAIARGILDDLKKAGKRALSVEGLRACSWVLIDFGDVVVHVFHADYRTIYDLDGLWLDAARVPMQADAKSLPTHGNSDK